MTTYNEGKHPRGQAGNAGQFRNKSWSDPEAALAAPTEPVLTPDAIAEAVVFANYLPAEAVVFANHLPEDGQTAKDVFQEALEDRALGIDDIIAAGPQTVTVFEVRNGDAKHPVHVVTEEYGPERPYKPSQSMRRAMASAWGVDVSDYAGRRMTLFRNTTIEPDKDELGGIQISHLSYIERQLTVSRGHRAAFIVQPLGD